jgi:hypothetical protein
MMKKIRQNLKSKTVWLNVATAAAGITAYLVANPALVAAYGPQAIVVIGIANVLLRNVTTKSIDDK